MSSWEKWKEKHWNVTVEYLDQERGPLPWVHHVPPLRRFIKWLHTVGIDHLLGRTGKVITIIGGIVAIYMTVR